MPLTGDHAKRWRTPRLEPYPDTPCNSPAEIVAYCELVQYLARHRHDVGLTPLQHLTLGCLVAMAHSGQPEVQAWNLVLLLDLESGVVTKQLDGLLIQEAIRERRVKKGRNLVRMVQARPDIVEGALHDPSLRPIFDLIVRIGRKLEAARAQRPEPAAAVPEQDDRSSKPAEAGPDILSALAAQLAAA